jgi:nitrate reductase gamma subunit
MRLFITIITLFIIGIWVVLGVFLLGYLQIEGVSLTLPQSTSDFSESTGVLSGLFSSLAVVLALIAVLLQGKLRFKVRYASAHRGNPPQQKQSLLPYAATHELGLDHANSPL